MHQILITRMLLQESANSISSFIEHKQIGLAIRQIMSYSGGVPELFYTNKTEINTILKTGGSMNNFLRGKIEVILVSAIIVLSIIVGVLYLNKSLNRQTARSVTESLIDFTESKTPSSTNSETPLPEGTPENPVAFTVNQTANWTGKVEDSYNSVHFVQGAFLVTIQKVEIGDVPGEPDIGIAKVTYTAKKNTRESISDVRVSLVAKYENGGSTQRFDVFKTGGPNTWFVYVKKGIKLTNIEINDCVGIDPEVVIPINQTFANNNSSTEQQASYVRYTNERYGFSIDYPSFLVVKSPSASGDGITMKTADNSVELTVWGSNNSLDQSVTSVYNESIKEHKNISFKTQSENWFVISWQDGDRIFYQKTVIGTGSINGFVISYPFSQNKTFDPIITELSSNFKTPLTDSAH